MITPKITNLGYSNLWTGMSTILGYRPNFEKLIAKLFANNEQGFFYDPNDLTTMFQDAAGTVPVTGVGQAVGLIRDKSGRNNHAYQTTSASRPTLSIKYNFWQYTEEVQSNRYSTTSSTKQPETILYNGVTLSRVTGGNFYSSLRSAIEGLRLSPFSTGKRYLISCYIKSSVEQFVWMRYLNDGGSNGHGAKFIDSTTKRISILAQATSPSKFSFVNTPTNALGSNVGTDPYWFFQGNTETGATDIYIGGFQIDEVPTSYTDGIAMIGDSTMAGASAFKDSSSTSAREVSVWLGALLNTNVFNRAIGGNKLTDMIARWDTDIKPLKVNSKYVVIQGGINDIANGATLDSVKASMNTLVSYATRDGFIPVVFTCSPASSIAANPAYESVRVAFNQWIVSTFTNTVDIATVLADPNNQSLLNPLWVGDGIHYTATGKRIAGELAAKASFWDFFKPNRYQRVTGVNGYETTGFSYYAAFDGIDDKLVTNLPAQLIGAIVIRAVPNVGTQILTNQTIATPYTDSTDHCGLIVINRALTQTETAQITQIFNRLAGV